MCKRTSIHSRQVINRFYNRGWICFIDKHKNLFCVMSFFLLSCSHQPISVTSGSLTCKEVNLKCFEQIAAKTTFRKETSVVWYPELPRTIDPILLVYNTESTVSRFTDRDQITFQYVSLSDVSSTNQVQRIMLSKTLLRGKDGLRYIWINPGEIVEIGFMTFHVPGKMSDNNYGSPWKMAVVEKLPLYRKVERIHFNYFYLEEDTKTDQSIHSILQNFEKSLTQIQKVANLELDRKFNFYFYQDRSSLMRYQANRGNYVEEYRDRVYSCEFPVDMHETTHLLFSQIGRHSGLFSEGIAVHLGQEIVQNGWRNHSCSWWAKRLVMEKRLPSLGTVITSDRFYSGEWSTIGDIHYPVACSFVGFLLQRNDMEQFKRFYASINPENQNSKIEILDLFLKYYGASLETVESEWRSKLLTELP